MECMHNAGCSFACYVQMLSSQSGHSGHGWSVFYRNGGEMKTDLLKNWRAFSSFVKMRCINESQGSIYIYNLLPLSLQRGWCHEHVWVSLCEGEGGRDREGVRKGRRDSYVWRVVHKNQIKRQTKWVVVVFWESQSFAWHLVERQHDS